MSETHIEKIYSLLSGYHTVMLVTAGASSTCHIRPMAVARVDKNTDLWLFTSRDSAKVREIEADSEVQVIGQEGWTNCLVLAGRASIEEDRSLIHELWKPSFKAWFPNGADDPDIVLLRIKAEQAEYWDNTGMNQFRFLYQSIKALATGTTPDIQEGEQHGKVALAH
jgi:general stress protein 26